MRAAALVLGLGVLIVAWFTRVSAVLPGPFSRHMTVHMAVVALAAPLLTLAIAGSALDPVRRFPRAFPPVPLSLVELVAVWLWHAPALHHFARHSSTGFVIEQGTFLLSGLLVWLSALGGRAERRNRTGAGLLALLLTSMHMTLLGALLALPPRVLYVHPGESDLAAALSDQHLGGAIMLLAGGLSYLLGGLWLTARLLRDRARRRVELQPFTGTNPGAARRS